MYEKSKRGNNKNKKESPNAKNSKAIILTWNVQLGEVELKAQIGKNQFTVVTNCIQGLILLNF
jgi:hypothetical protein